MRAGNLVGSQNPEDVGDGIGGDFRGEVPECRLLGNHLSAIFALRQFSKSGFGCPHVLHDFVDSDDIALGKVFRPYGLDGKGVHMTRAKG